MCLKKGTVVVEMVMDGKITIAHHWSCYH
jgi:hypothetical protein